MGQLSVFAEVCSRACAAYGVCGGTDTAPCSCVWVNPDLRYKCESCPIMCRERDAKTRPGDTFENHVATGLPLKRLKLSQPSNLVLPVLLPSCTHLSMKDVGRLPLRWAAVDGNELLTDHTTGPVQPKAYLQNALEVREHLQVPAACQLLAVLNTNDTRLEGFWGMPRLDFLSRLHSCGFSAATGPTFSVFGETNEGVTTPASHHALMLMRHHMIIKEMQDVGLPAVPNLYWANEREQQRWVEWLNKNEQVHTISRDFSRTKQPAAFIKRLVSLGQILERVNRPLHLILVGVGAMKASQAVHYIASLGHTCSIVTTDPILQATFGHELSINTDGVLEKLLKSPKIREKLFLDNLVSLDTYLVKLVSTLAPYAARMENPKTLSCFL